MKKYMIRLGTTMITTAASCIVQLVEYCPLNRVRLTGSVIFSGSVININANINSFHALTKLNMEMVAIEDFESGKIILQNTPDILHPSIIAASSISLGNDAINPLRINMDVGNANAVYGNTSEIKLLSILILLNAIKSGISVECIGIMIPTRKIPSTSPEYFHLNLFSANAAMDEIIMVNTTDKSETTTELKKPLPTFPETQAVT